jgi:hypothetical protein
LARQSFVTYPTSGGLWFLIKNLVKIAATQCGLKRSSGTIEGC